MASGLFGQPQWLNAVFHSSALVACAMQEVKAKFQTLQKVYGILGDAEK
jgi:hypothetical protein